MTDDREARRERKRREIQEHACRLVVTHGFDGFTMDDLAEAVGVSRRTLFNYVPDKASAVIGADRGDRPRGLEEFVAGGPSGELVPDVLHVVRLGLHEAETSGQDAVGRVLMLERAIAADPKVAGLMKQVCEHWVDALAEVVCTREQWVSGDLRSRVLVARVLSTLALTLEEVVRRRGTGALDAVYEEVLAADAELFAGRGQLVAG